MNRISRIQSLTLKVFLLLLILFGAQPLKNVLAQKDNPIEGTDITEAKSFSLEGEMAQIPLAAPTFYMDDSAGFITAVGSKTFKGLEDFESSTLAANMILAFDDPLAPGVPNSIFPNGTVSALGLTLQSNTLGANPTTVSPRGTNGLVTASQGYLGTPTDQVGNTFEPDSLDLIFSLSGGEVVTAVSFIPLFFDDAGIDPTDTLTVRVFDSANNFLGSSTIVGGDYINTNSFVGVTVSGTDSIGRINLVDSSSTNDYVGVDEVRVYAFSNPINQAPTLSNVAVTSPINENDLATLTGDITDPDTGDTFDLVIDWGNGVSNTLALPAGTTAFTTTLQYVDDDPSGTPSDTFPINLTLYDSGGSSDTDSTSVTVNNLPPSLSNLSAPVIDENTLATLTGNLSDPSAQDHFTLIIDWGDGISETLSISSGISSFSRTHLYPDDTPSTTSFDVYPVSFVLIDDDTGVTSANTTVTVNNLPPTLSNLAVTPVNENGLATLTGNLSDPSPADSFTLEVAWGDGDVETILMGSGTTAFNLTHQYLDDDPSGTPSDVYTLAVTLTDDDTGVDTAVPTVTVTNLAPSLSNLAATPLDESQITTLSGSISDVGVLDSFTVFVDWGDGGTDTYSYPAGTAVFTETHVYQDGLVLTPVDTDYTINVTLMDDDAGQDTGSVLVSISNIAPTITSLGTDSPTDENGFLSILGTFTDPSPLDTFTVVVDWGDGSVLTATYPAGAFDFMHTHQYLDDNPTGTPSDSYTVSVTLTDDDGGTDSDTTTITVNNVAPAVDAGSNQTAGDATVVNFNGAFTDPGTLDTHTIEWDFGDGNTASGTLTPAHTFPGEGVYTVTLTVTDDDTGWGADTTLITILPEANLTLSKQAAPGPVLAGLNLDYTLAVTNTGPSPVSGVVITDTLPNGVSFVSGSAGCSEANGLVTCLVGDLANGASANVNLTVEVLPETSGIVTNTATVNSAGFDPDLSDNTASAATEVVPYLIVYEEDFEDPPIGDEWDCTTLVISTTPVGNRHFLGEFGAETVCLSLDNLPTHTQVQVVFDLYLIRSWDGNQVDLPNSMLVYSPDSVIGPDVWRLEADAALLLETTFSNWKNLSQAYPGMFPDGDFPAWTGAVEVNTLGYDFTGLPKDAVYHLVFTFDHSGDTLMLDFISQQVQDILDESWGLDNVQVAMSAGGSFSLNYRLFLPIVTR